MADTDAEKPAQAPALPRRGFGWSLAALIAGLVTLSSPLWLSPLRTKYHWFWRQPTHGYFVQGLLLNITALLALVTLALTSAALARRGRGTLGTIAGLAVAVLAVAGYLGWHGLPSVLAHRDQVSCLSDMKLFCLSMASYSEEHDGKLPIMGPAWFNEIWHYTLNNDAWYCGADPDPRAGFGRMTDHPYTSFRMNRNMSGKPAAWTRQALPALGPNERFAEMTNAAQVPLIFDGKCSLTFLGGPEDAEFRHMGGINVGFADGHRAWLTPEQFQAVEWEPKYAAKK